MPRIKLREYRSSVHKPPQKCTQLNGRMHVHVVWECVIIIRLVYCVPQVLYS